MLIELVAKRCYTRWELMTREWDGIDQPCFTTVMPLLADEKDLNKGRFERYDISASNYLIKLRPTGNTTMEKLINWISLNAKGKWFIYPGWAHWDFTFEYQEDAVLFKLFWL